MRRKNHRLGQPKTIEQISYAEYDVIKPYLIKEGE